MSKNATYTNPMLPGWHSDPTCIFVAEADNTFFCVTSTFLVFPGLPVYASKDLQNWKLISHVFSRQSQLPALAQASDQQNGIYAPTLRYHDGSFYVIVVAVGSPGDEGLIFNTTDPYKDSTWSEPARFEAPGIDPDLFWDDDGQVYATFQGILQARINPRTAEMGEVYSIWNGTGGTWPEGPHVYKKDDYYYLSIAEGGTELGHSETVARSRNISGPYEAYTGNPILSNRNTTEYFQTVGHADYFKDEEGNWWGVALSTRSGPAWLNYPMGRETVLFPMTWEEGKWPAPSQVRSHMSGPLPPVNVNITGAGSFVKDPDNVDFIAGSLIPMHFVHWRFPPENAFKVSPEGYPNTLQLMPSRNNLTATNASRTEPFTFISRVQTDTTFNFSVDALFDGTVEGEEVGATIFLTQLQHADIGIVLLPVTNSRIRNSTLAPHLRFRVTGRGNVNGTLPAPNIQPVPNTWLGQPIRLHIDATSDTEYELYVSSATDDSDIVTLGTVPATLLSGGTGPFTGKH